MVSAFLQSCRRCQYDIRANLDQDQHDEKSEDRLARLLLARQCASIHKPSRKYDDTLDEEIDHRSMIKLQADDRATRPCRLDPRQIICSCMREHNCNNDEHSPNVALDCTVCHRCSKSENRHR